jgi:Sulfatase
MLSINFIWNKLKNTPIFLLLIGFFYSLHGAVENFGFIYFADAFSVATVVLVGTLFLFAFFFLLSKRIQFAAIISLFVSVWYFFFGAIKDSLNDTIPSISRYPVLVFLLIILTIVLGLLIRKKILLQQKLTLYLNGLFIIYCLLDTSILVFKIANKREIKLDTSIMFHADLVKHKPNVYYLLFDEYAGYKNLQDSFNFSNDKLYNHLKENGFSEKYVTPNYSMTPFCMSSIFNMKYIEGIKDTNNITFDDYQERSREISNATVFNLFEKMGYQIHNFSIFDIKNQKSVESNSFILGNDQLLNNKMFHNRVLKDLAHLFLFGKYGVDFFRDLVFNQNAVYNRSVENKLLQTLNGKKQPPKFVYAHFLIPHSTILFDSLGNRIPNKIIAQNTISPSLTKGLYLSYLKYANTKITTLADNIIQKDSSAIVIIMSDHGYRDWETRNKFQPFSFDNMCFVRNLKNEISSPTPLFTSVNFFRFLFNEQYNQSIPYIKDSIGLSLAH